ncbi:hypothetical protein B7495_04725 [Cryobacterium sp. LW097]|uniref:hypothetical protein n=1 Tax=Cryobacterium sp. LW097 TaxID=1978566 RepID=UPI000B4D6847|nr:hypothetical protein [Cryobacterium sp. LW097]ASD21478.1 hypothetical protein B7495_04725 [Cryobacterium sp. LW097]
MNHQTTNETCTAAIAAPTPKMLAHIEAHPGWADAPVVDLMRAGFTAEEYESFFDMIRIQPIARVQDWDIAEILAVPDMPKGPAAMRATAEKLLLAADCREQEDANIAGQRVIDVAFPDGKLGAAFHLVQQKMAGSAYISTINIRVDGPWASEMDRATSGSTFGSTECTFTYIGLFDYVREWYDSEARHMGRFVERATFDGAAQVSL